ncbi:proline-rich protein 36 [Alosa sapidissima]|uniref:proline-rich protein 36 n=1 Tax=Alosa sapidissima TaxID=34773 RepID=UPI001C095541|nr:proline-rich protein 36 [Alosa sapidissima]
MNLNDFVILPNKPKSVKLNTRVMEMWRCALRNLRELRMETVQLAQESTAMESRLQQLRESMSREKEERERSGGFRWKSGKAGALTGPAARRNRENAAPKVPGAKVKIRVLRDEPLAGECVSEGHGKMEGVLSFGSHCPAEVQTSVSALDVVHRFKQQVSPKTAQPASAPTGQGKKEPAIWTYCGEREPAVNHMRVRRRRRRRSGPRRRSVASLPGGSSLLRGHFDEGGVGALLPAGSAVVEGGRREGDAADTPQQVQAHRPHSAALPVSTEATGTQADLQSKTLQPIHVEFTEPGLCYLDKLLIKKHRRMPIEEYRPLSSEASTQERLTPSSTETDGESHRLTEEEKELRKYLAALFTVPPAGGVREPHSPTKPSLSIVEMAQTVCDAVGTSAFGVEQRGANTKLDGGRESVSERGKSEERRSVGTRSSASSSSPRLPASPGPRFSPGGGSSIPSDQSPTPPPGPAPRAALRPTRSPVASRPSPRPASGQSAASSGQRFTKSPRSRGSCSPKTDRMKTSSIESKTPSPRSRPASSSQGLGVTPSPPHPLQTPSSSEPQSPAPLCTPGPSRPSSPGSRTSAQPSTPGSTVEASPPSSRMEATPHPTRDSTPPQTPYSLTPVNTSTPPSADPSTPPAHSHQLPDSDSDSEEEEEEAEEREDWKGSVGLLLDEWDSSDEELSCCVGGGDTLCPSPSPPSRCRSAEEEPSSPLGLGHSDGRLSDPALFTEPSSALQALAQRLPTQAHSFLGLDGFLTLGVDVSSARPSSGPVSACTHTPQVPGPQRSPPPYRGGQLSWRPSSSLRESAPDELVLAVLESQSPRHTLSRPPSAARRLHSAGRVTPCPAPRPVSVSRPLSRAAQEILEVQSVEQEAPCDGEEHEEEEEEDDRQALASLEEEFRQMSAQPGEGPGVCRGPMAAHGSPTGSEGHRPTGRSASGASSGASRCWTSRGHLDEEDNLGDKHDVLALR